MKTEWVDDQADLSLLFLYPATQQWWGIMVSCWTSVCLSFRPSVCQSYFLPSILFPDDNLSKHQCIVTKFGMCINIVEIWFGIANGQISSNFDGVICPRHAHIFVSGWKLEKTSMDFHQTWYVH